MTSVSYRQDSAPAQAERSGRPEIVHFDATVRRKEKMRHLAGQERAETVNDVAPAERRANPAAKPAAAPAPVPPVAARPAAPPRPAAAPPVRPASAPAPAVPKAPSVSSAPAPAPARAAVAAPVSAPAPAASQTAPAAAKPLNVDLAELETVLINFVVEQTGYPPEMVELDADLEADLGIDSIKKAQMLGELAEQLDVQITISEDMSLDDFPTLRHITDFLRKSAEGSAVSGAGSAAAAVPSSPVAAAPAPATPARAAADVNGHPSVSRSAASAAPSMPAAPAPAPAAASGVAALDKAGLEQFLVNFVVEQTGYPPEMVELDADLEADLGIDSIKKAQLFGELAEQLNIQITITEDMSLDQFPTLRHVLDALSSGSPGGAAAAAPTVVETVAPAAPVARPTAAAAAPAAAAVADAAASSSGKVAVASLNPAELEAFLVNFVVEQTGYPPEMVELDADLEADLGIDSIKKAQLFGELAENLDVQIQITEDMSLDNYRSLRDVLNLLLQNQA